MQQHLAKHHTKHMHQPCTSQAQPHVTFPSSTKLRKPWQVKICKWRRLIQCCNFYRSPKNSKKVLPDWDSQQSKGTQAVQAYFKGDESVITVSLVSSVSQHQYRHPFNQVSYSGIYYYDNPRKPGLKLIQA